MDLKWFLIIDRWSNEFSKFLNSPFKMINGNLIWAKFMTACQDQEKLSILHLPYFLITQIHDIPGVNKHQLPLYSYFLFSPKTTSG